MIVDEFFHISKRALLQYRNVEGLQVTAVEQSILGPRVRWTGYPIAPPHSEGMSRHLDAQHILESLSRYLACRWRNGSPRVAWLWADRLAAHHSRIFQSLAPASSAGWSWLWESAAIHIEEVGVPRGFKTTDTKEKFGTMRWYYDANENCEKLDTIIECVEHLSGYICEYCGSPGKMRKGSWIKTLCDLHHAEREGK